MHAHGVVQLLLLMVVVDTQKQASMARAEARRSRIPLVVLCQAFLVRKVCAAGAAVEARLGPATAMLLLLLLRNRRHAGWCFKLLMWITKRYTDRQGLMCTRNTPSGRHVDCDCGESVAKAK